MAKRLNLATSAIALSAAALMTTAAVACTSVVLPPGSTVGGFSSVSHTCDSGNSPYEFYKIPAQTYERGTMVDVYYIPQTTNGWKIETASYPLGVQIPQVDHTFSYFKSGIFGYMNEKQVAIGETTISGRRELKNANGYFDITNLSMLGLERGATARECILAMGELAETYGYKDGGEELSVADPDEAWIFEIIGPGPMWTQGDDAPGAFWIAQRVPDGHVAASANHPVIDTVDWDDPDYFMYSPGILEYAQEQGWWSPDSGEEFSWKKHFVAYNSPSTCGRRIWRVMTLCNPSLVDELDENDLPFSVPVAEKLTMEDIMAIHADHYEGTAYDLSNGITAGPWKNPRRYRPQNIKYNGVSYAYNRSISQVQCEYVTITQSRKWLPDEIGGVVWYGPCNPDLTCYVPLYAGMTELTDVMSVGSKQEFTRESFRWAVSAVSTFADYMYSYISKDILAYRDANYTGKWLREQETIDKIALELYKQDVNLGREFLTNYCNNNIIAARDGWWALLDELFRKYDMTQIYNGDPATGQGKGSATWDEDYVRFLVNADPIGTTGEVANNNEVGIPVE